MQLFELTGFLKCFSRLLKAGKAPAKPAQTMSEDKLENFTDFYASPNRHRCTVTKIQIDQFD